MVHGTMNFDIEALLQFSSYEIILNYSNIVTYICGYIFKLYII